MKELWGSGPERPDGFTEYYRLTGVVLRKAASRNWTQHIGTNTVVSVASFYFDAFMNSRPCREIRTSLS